MKLFRTRLINAFIGLFALGQTISLTLAQEGSLQFDELPTEVQSHVNKNRQACKEDWPEHKISNMMQGITVIDLDGDGSRDLMVDNGELCDHWMPGGNCSNRGCDTIIWKQVGRNWRKIFDEHLHRKIISLKGSSGRFHSMTVSIYAGSPQCRPDPRIFYSSGKSCDLLVSYRNGQWVWEPIRAESKLWFEELVDTVPIETIPCPFMGVWGHPKSCFNQGVIFPDRMEAVNGACIFDYIRASKKKRVIGIDLTCRGNGPDMTMREVWVLKNDDTQLIMHNLNTGKELEYMKCPNVCGEAGPCISDEEMCVDLPGSPCMGDPPETERAIEQPKEWFNKQCGFE